MTVMAGVALLGSAPVLAQGDQQPAATASPTALPGEEKLSARERAERDFLMPVRRKQAEALKAAAQQEAEAARTAADMTARNEAPAEAKPAEAAEVRKSSVTAHRARRPTSSSRHHTTARKKKGVRKSSSTKRKTTKKTSSRRRR